MKIETGLTRREAICAFAAIPAALAFNHFTAKNDKVYQSRSLFCDEMTGMLLRQTVDTTTNLPKGLNLPTMMPPLAR